MFFNRIFREKALARRQRQEPLDDLLKVTAPHEYLLLAGLGILIVGLLVYVVVGTVERSISYDAVLVHPGERHIVFSPVSGTVVEVLAQAGDTVETGFAIARVQPAASQRLESALLRLEEQPDEDFLKLLLSLSDAGNGGEPVIGGEVVTHQAGDVMRLDLVPGQVVTAGEPVALVRSHDAGPQDALTYVTSGDASRIDVGMDAQVRLTAGQGGEAVFKARVATLSDQPAAPPQWLADMGFNSLESGHLLRVTLPDDVHAADGSPVALRVVLGRNSIVELLLPGRLF